jgi:aminomethyltransferase
MGAPPMIMTTELARTPLYDWHVAHGGRMVDFAGWSMPVQYTSITAEHRATRSAVGVFDISHMGRLQFLGPRAAEFLDTVTTRRVADLQPAQIRYSLVCNENGGILDDVLVYGGEPDGSRPCSMVVNASNRAKIVDWLQVRANEWLAENADATLSIGDDTHRTAMIAVQGPRALDTLGPFFALHASAPALDLGGMRYYHSARGQFDGVGVLVSRTGYTGEDGFEVMLPKEGVEAFWYDLNKVGVKPIGLGARDTLRLEAGMNLYGQDMDETVGPLESGLAWTVDLKSERDFIGKAALLANPPSKKLVGLVLLDRGVLRGHQKVVSAQGDGEITSGTFSPTLEKSIALARVPNGVQIGDTVQVEIRDKLLNAKVVKYPFARNGKGLV